MFEVGKEYRFRACGKVRDEPQPMKCVFAGNYVVILRDCEGREHVSTRSCYCNWEEYHKSVIEERFMSIRFTEVPPCAVAIYMGPKHREDDNVKLTFTDGNLTEVKII